MKCLLIVSQLVLGASAVSTRHLNIKHLASSNTNRRTKPFSDAVGCCDYSSATKIVAGKHGHGYDSDQEGCLLVPGNRMCLEVDVFARQPAVEPNGHLSNEVFDPCSSKTRDTAKCLISNTQRA